MADKEKILTSMLEDVSNEYDKRPGSFIYDALAPVACKFEETDQSIDIVKEKLNIENLSGDELELRVYQKTGIHRKKATKAIGSVTLTGTGTIHEGDLFETEGGTQFRATETKIINTSRHVSIEALIAGTNGIVAANTITLFPVTLTGFTSVTNTEPTHDGYEEESDNDLLVRYYDRIRTPATSGNKNHYKNWAKEVPGVGDAQVIPLWNGDNTVKVVIINSARQPSSPDLVQTVQQYIDPDGTGKGDGVAPIGAFVTVESAIGIDVNVTAQIELASGHTIHEVTNNFIENLTQYLAGIAFVESIVSYAKIGALLLSTTGVADYVNLLVNGSTTNPNVQPEEVAVVGSVLLDVIE